jgi:hypothetical protein
MRRPTARLDLSSYAENFDELRTLLRRGTITGPRVAFASRIAAVAWTGDDVLSFAFAFEMTGQSGGQRWIELDNVRLFQ